jgi:hypothetical protein
MLVQVSFAATELDCRQGSSFPYRMLLIQLVFNPQMSSIIWPESFSKNGYLKFKLYRSWSNCVFCSLEKILTVKVEVIARRHDKVAVRSGVKYDVH